MFDDQDRAYFARRAATERKLASEASDPAIRKIHADMAEEYQRMSEGAEPQCLVRRPADKPLFTDGS
ncbi:hypothetical protein [Sphingomonas hylomeconis]|uniref:hypothetical protein n=1 Tax=Sphingomonas hylomeconis TaxID=1395958 RepID=UPI0021BB4882|nr:hypothetical protein [Sphingomonas hylomeconis]